MEKSSKNLNIPLPILKANPFDDGYCSSGAYLLECEDYKEKRSKDLGKGNKIEILAHLNNNHRESKPQIGIIKSSVGEVDFKVGDRVYCHHFSFLDDMNNRRSDVKLSDGTDLVEVRNYSVFCKIEDDDSLTPRHQVILCEPLTPINFLGIKVDIEMGIKDYRRDLVRVLKCGTGLPSYIEPGKFLIIEEGGDYIFNYKGKDYVKVDYAFDDILGVVDSEEWFNPDAKKHDRSHGQISQDNM